MNDQINEQNVVDGFRYICTVKADTFEGKRAIIKARNTAQSLNGAEVKSLVVVGVYTAPGVRSQTGRRCVNVYLYANDGKVYFSQSSGIYRSVMDIYDMFPDFNAPDGIPVVVQSTPLKNGRTIKTLDIQ